MPITYITPDRRRDIPAQDVVVDGYEFTARCPKESQWVRLIATGARHTPVEEAARAVDVFFEVCLDEEAAAHLEARLRDQDDGFDFADIVELIRNLSEAWQPYMSEETKAAAANISGNREVRRATAKRPSPARR